MRYVALALPLTLLAACGDEPAAPAPADAAQVAKPSPSAVDPYEQKAKALKAKAASLNTQKAPTPDQTAAIASVTHARQKVTSDDRANFHALLDCWKRDHGTDIIPAEAVIKASLTVTDDSALVAKCLASLRR